MIVFLEGKIGDDLFLLPRVPILIQAPEEEFGSVRGIASSVNMKYGRDMTVDPLLVLFTRGDPIESMF